MPAPGGGGSWGNQGFPHVSDADDVHEPAPVALAVELEEEHPLPAPEAEDAVAHGDRLARRAHQHRHAVRVTVRGLHVLLGDVLRPAVPVVVRVVVLGGHEPPEKDREILEEAALVLVHPHGTGRVRGVDAAHAVAYTALRTASWTWSVMSVTESPP